MPDYPAANTARPALLWSSPDVGTRWYQSRYSGLTCHKCAKQHPGTVAYRWGKYWYRCDTCSSVFCPECAPSLSLWVSHGWSLLPKLTEEYECAKATCKGQVVAV